MVTQKINKISNLVANKHLFDLFLKQAAQRCSATVSSH